ncbi:hypothetical protein LCGC14_2243720 [marine sediment metagenome]|uniref:Uncharacterized protein n=1 Tax=marine sediment metagenome TaxID=412755 RepID=A0A0F9D4U5_9ZZZZ
MTQDHNFDIAREHLIRWKERTVRIISEEIKEGDVRKLHPLIASCIDIQLNIELGNLI